MGHIIAFDGIHPCGQGNQVGIAAGTTTTATGPTTESPRGNGAGQGGLTGSEGDFRILRIGKVEGDFGTDQPDAHVMGFAVHLDIFPHMDAGGVHVNQMQVNRLYGQRRAFQNGRVHIRLCLFQQVRRLRHIVPDIGSPYFPIEGNTALAVNVIHTTIDGGDAHTVAVIAAVVRLFRVILVPLLIFRPIGNQAGDDTRSGHISLDIQQILTKADGLVAVRIEVGKVVDIPHTTGEPGADIATQRINQAGVDGLPGGQCRIAAPVDVVVGVLNRDFPHGELPVLVYLAVVVLNQGCEQLCRAALKAKGPPVAVHQKRQFSLAVDGLPVIEIPRHLNHPPTEQLLSIVQYTDDGVPGFDGIVTGMVGWHGKGHTAMGVGCLRDGRIQDEIAIIIQAGVVNEGIVCIDFIHYSHPL